VIIRPPVIKRLFAQSGNQCAFPTCRPPSWKVKPSWARFATSRARAHTAPAKTPARPEPSAAQIGQCRLWDFSPRQIDWIENRRAIHGHRVVPGMRTRSSGNAARPRRQIPLQFSHFATKGEIRRESSGGCGRFTPQEFREQRFHHRSRKLSLLSGRIDNGASSIRHESTRSERKTRRSGRHPMISALNGAY
jgi:hypothetical protein